MEKFETHILLIKPETVSDGRILFEQIENVKYESIEALQNAICYDEDNPVDTEDLKVIPLTEFMDWLNNHDDDLPKKERFNPSKFWFGYVQIRKG